MAIGITSRFTISMLKSAKPMWIDTIEYFVNDAIDSNHTYIKSRRSKRGYER